MTSSVRCAIYTRKSTEEGLEQEFNSLDAQRESCEAYVLSQAGEGWVGVAKRYDDGGYSGGTLERPALQSLLSDIDQGRVDVVAVYKIDRLTRSLADFAKLVERFDARNVSFVSVTQAFSTSTSMGRLQRSRFSPPMKNRWNTPASYRPRGVMMTVEPGMRSSETTWTALTGTGVVAAAKRRSPTAIREHTGDRCRSRTG